MSLRTVSILGATGSIGRATLSLIEAEPERFEVVALTANTDVPGLAEAARRTRARLAVIGDESLLPELREALAGSGVQAAAGAAAVTEAAARPTDWTMAAIVGTAGLAPVMAALERGGTLALANKEALVSAGALVTNAARRRGVQLLPVDSEHNAIWQCFPHDRPDAVARIILTASGGPFRDWSRDRMAAVTPAEAVKHPNWAMGAKISVDSATLMNKGLELIEAAYLFPVPEERIEVLIHPQSVVHSLVAYHDGSVLAELGSPDMRTPIAHTLAWPERMRTDVAPLDLAGIGRLDFQAPDTQRFPALALAREVLRAGGARPAVLNAANEVAVASFLDGRLPFLAVAQVVADTLAAYDPPAPATLEAVLEVDRGSRQVATEIGRRLTP